jgi:hypothetical protein
LLLGFESFSSFAANVIAAAAAAAAAEHNPNIRNCAPVNGLAAAAICTFPARSIVRTRELKKKDSFHAG